MTLSISELRDRVKARFSEFEQINDSVIRFTKTSGSHAFAVCYVDIAQDLPGSQETLIKYQDRIIGTHYFDGEKSLQWNNYLYFVTDEEHVTSGDGRRIKELIERDRTYARKFVISEDELDLVLTSPAIAPTTRGPQSNILSTWTDRLVEAGLDRAIMTDANLPKRLALIEAPPSTTRKAKQAPTAVEVKALPFIRSIRLSKFRPFPLQRDFRFGNVNLIFGPNATGKTSLLEAIELFYCGKNNRNPDAALNYALDVVLADGHSETVSGHPLQEYRDRNLNWYGVPEVKTSKLCSSFAQFNFLDTDAAVSLAESTSRIDDDLSKLLVGPDASKTWENINKVCDEVSSRLNELLPLERQISEEIAALDKQTAEAGAVRQESDVVHSRLKEIITQLGWKSLDDKKESFAAMLIETFSELAAVAQQASSLEWTQSPVSIKGLVKYCREAKVTIEKVEPDISRLERLQSSLKSHSDSIKRGREALDLIQEAKRLFAANVSERVAEAAKQRTLIASYSERLAGRNPEALLALSSTPGEMTVVSLRQSAISARSAADALLAKTKSEYAHFSRLRTQSLNLAQELRQIASRILEGSPKPDDCPLCHTQFAPGELVKHMNLGVDEHLETAGQTLLSQLSEGESYLRSASAQESAATWIETFCKRANLGNATVRSALIEIEKTAKSLTDAQDRLKSLNEEISALEGQGLSVKKLKEVTGRLEAIGYPLKSDSQAGADAVFATINQTLTTETGAYETEKKRADELERSLQAAFNMAEPAVQQFKSALSRLKERLARTEMVRSKLAGLLSSFSWSEDRPVAELAVEAEAVRAMASELQAALRRELQARTTLAESAKRKETLLKDQADLKPKIKRFSDAFSVLNSLRNEHSLSHAMESALRQNRKAIEAIFSRIHSPAEFRGLGPEFGTLIRKSTGQQATLSEISTGQRAAFALSIFFAQNLQLTAAPPAILIDDPIAHVDDLNSLSFLDYLREIALTGKRQIFFATASDKLATLFERKFDFMGSEGFRRLNLQRTITQ